MCIRDSASARGANVGQLLALDRIYRQVVAATVQADDLPLICLLYTSDAADERSSVDLGGRRIIKKKKTPYTSLRATYQKVHLMQ